LIYMDNAATSFPKPPEVIEAVTHYLTNIGGSPARSSHSMALEAARTIYKARENIARLVGLEDPLRVAFTSNATTAINYGLRGLISPGKHVITTGVEHNSVMRPLKQLQQEGIEVSVVPCSSEGFVDTADIVKAIRRNTAMVVMVHASNVLGSIQPVCEVGKICREKGIRFLVDAAQTLGILDIDMERDCVDLLAFSGHKALYGPQGTGGLAVSRNVKGSEIKPIVCGGTGSRSETDVQPNFLPDVLESGTPNGAGLAGLGASTDFVLATGTATIWSKENALTEKLVRGLREINSVKVYGPEDSKRRIGVVPFNIIGFDPSVVAYLLEDRYRILTRAGLHCAPMAHKTAGTFPVGCVRMSLSWFTTESEIDTAIQAVRELTSE